VRAAHCLVTTGYWVLTAGTPDPGQEALFFGLVRECLEKGVVTEVQLRDEMEQNHLRHDALELVGRVPPLAA
jgi:hypothetical protein